MNRASDARIEPTFDSFNFPYSVPADPLWFHLGSFSILLGSHLSDDWLGCRHGVGVWKITAELAGSDKDMFGFEIRKMTITRQIRE